MDDNRPPGLVRAFTNYSTQFSGDEESDSSTKSSIGSIVSEEGWYSEGLCVIVIGASGDLAKKKTYPSLLNLFYDNLLPYDTIIWGYARSPKSHESLRSHLKPHLMKTGDCSESIVDAFLSKCYYKSGSSYGDVDAYKDMMGYVEDYEASFPQKVAHNRLFYLAIPPNVFAETGIAIKQTAMQLSGKGWSRLIIEKPFGRDLESCDALSKTLSAQFEEHHLYRIDHYLGKEVVQNLLIFRFGNSWLEWLWNRNAIQSVTISFKENFGTEGRGGYFDQYGIIRDIIQNHLLQVLMLVAMEPPSEADGPNAGDFIRDSKVQVLKAMDVVSLDDCLLGQYEGYADDPTIPREHSNTPTYAAVKCSVHSPRWEGVPFILEAGKALDERKCEVRIQFRRSNTADSIFGCSDPSSKEGVMPRNELVMRLQPDPAIYMTTNLKSPGFASKPIQSSLGRDYETLFSDEKGSSNPDAYTRLILDVLRGHQASFVRGDELRKSWEVFTPLLHRIDEENIRPSMYKYGTMGPAKKAQFMERVGLYESDRREESLKTEVKDLKSQIKSMQQQLSKMQQSAL